VRELTNDPEETEIFAMDDFSHQQQPFYFARNSIAYINGALRRKTQPTLGYIFDIGAPCGAAVG
jgi:hypothetical protein